MEYRAALLASRGYATLALAYIGHKDLPGDPKRMNVGDLYFKVGGCWGFYSLFLHDLCDVTCFLLLFIENTLFFYCCLCTVSIPSAPGSPSGLC